MRHCWLDRRAVQVNTRCANRRMRFSPRPPRARQRGTLPNPVDDWMIPIAIMAILAWVSWDAYRAYRAEQAVVVPVDAAPQEGMDQPVTTDRLK